MKKIFSLCFAALLAVTPAAGNAVPSAIATEIARPETEILPGEEPDALTRGSAETFPTSSDATRKTAIAVTAGTVLCAAAISAVFLTTARKRESS